MFVLFTKLNNGHESPVNEPSNLVNELLTNGAAPFFEAFRVHCIKAKGFA